MIKQDTKQIKLGFSGGGFRATFYCLGGYRRLVELGIHRLVTDISSVSGGGIVAGAIMVALSEGDFSDVNEFDSRVIKKVKNLAQLNLRKKIMNKASRMVYFLPIVSLMTRTGAVFLMQYIRNKTSLAFPELLDEFLYKGKLIKDLPSIPEWSCNTTCLNTLKRFRFKTKNIYGYKLGCSEDINDITVAFAVAASASYPLAFSPLELSVRNRTFRDLYGERKSNIKPEKLYLTDGSVYDNLGSENLLRGEIPFITLDASAETEILETPSASFVFFDRIISTSMDQLVLLRRRLLFKNNTVDGVQLILNKSVLEISQELMSYKDIQLPSFDEIDRGLERLISSIRTDLDAFHDIEIEMLMWAGALRMDLALKYLFRENKYLKEIEPPLMPQYPLEVVREILERGKSVKPFGKRHKNLHFK